jgi:hypothetical protein
MIGTECKHIDHPRFASYCTVSLQHEESPVSMNHPTKKGSPAARKRLSTLLSYCCNQWHTLPTLHPTCLAMDAMLKPCVRSVFI